MQGKNNREIKNDMRNCRKTNLLGLDLSGVRYERCSSQTCTRGISISHILQVAVTEIVQLMAQQS